MVRSSFRLTCRFRFTGGRMPLCDPTRCGPTPAARTSSMDQVDIRHLRTEDEFAACIDLQRETWGSSFSDVVPVSMLQVSVKMGGVCMGAFGPDRELAGFVYGITGVRKGELAHWSHMLAVRPDLRDRGIGRRLKMAQADALRALGVKAVYWTYDPLVARNAHLNLNLLGATIDEYVPDMYGTSDSELHRLGTDRFIVRWCLEGEAPDRRRGDDDETVEVVIPGDIEAVEARSVDEALEWRRTTRDAFTRLLGDGGRVEGFVPGREYGRYLLVRKAEAP